MDHRERTILASAGVLALFLAVQLGALALVEPFQQEGHQVVEDTSNPSLSLGYVLVILVATALMLGVLKRGGASMLRVLLIFAGAYIAFFVLDVLAPSALAMTLAGVTFNPLAYGGAAAIGIALYVYPEWYVIDAAGVLMGIGAAGLFGINFGLLPAVVLLVVLAVYDAISVYGTEHMLTLASGVMEMRVPVVLVVPLSLSYSFRDADPPATLAGDEDTGDRAGDESEPLTAAALNDLSPEAVADLEASAVADLDQETLDALDADVREAIEAEFLERDALFIGLGDAVIPTVLVASAAVFLDSEPTVPLGVAEPPLAAVTAMAGTLLGLVVLLFLVTKGRAHAGLPLLNGGTIAGYLLGALASGIALAEALGLSGAS